MPNLREQRIYEAEEERILLPLTQVGDERLVSNEDDEGDE